MSFHNNSNNEFIPDGAGSSSYVSDHSTIYSGSGVSHLTDNSNSRSSRASSSRHTNRSDDSSSLRRDREREGRCADCGAETHEMQYNAETGMTRKVPLNIEGEVRRGRCLLCNPLPARSMAMQHQQQQQHFGHQYYQEQLPEEAESVQSSEPWRDPPRQSSFHSTGGGTSGYRQSSFHSTGTTQSSDGRDERRHTRHRSQRHAGRSDASVGSSQSYNSAPAQSYNTISTQSQSYNSAPAYHGNNMSSQRSQHSRNSNTTYPIGVTSTSDFNQSAAAAARGAPPLEEFTIERRSQHSRQLENPSSQRQRQQQQQQQQSNFRQQYRDNGRAASGNSIATDHGEIMAIEEEYITQESDQQAVSSRASQSQQQHQQPQQQSSANNEEAAIHQILSSMQRYPNHVPTQSKGLHSLWVLSWDDTNAATVGRLGGIPIILDSMRSHTNTPTLQSNGIATLQNLAMTPNNRATITESDGVAVIADVMAQVIEDKALQQSGCTALANLANGTPQQKACVAEGGGILAMMRAVDAHRGDESIMRAAYQALRKLGYTPGS